MTQKTTPTSVQLILHNDLNQPISAWMWWEANPTFLAVTGVEGRLLRAEVEALRDYCDAVLERMPPANELEDAAALMDRLQPVAKSEEEAQ